MRSFSHWTPAYIYNRLTDWYFRFRNPRAPWLTPRAIEYLENALQPEFTGLEYGSGRSTAWFAGRVKHLISVEHNTEWYSRVKSELEELGLKNVEYFHFPKPEATLVLQQTIVSEYVQASANLQDNSLDFALVDGIVRPACALRSLPLLKYGGLLIIDDANHYLPSDSFAPNSRSMKNGPLNEEWGKVVKALEGWNSVWFGNGIKETVVFRKPDRI
jgi:hypothetical protein